ALKPFFVVKAVSGSFVCHWSWFLLLSALVFLGLQRSSSIISQALLVVLGKMYHLRHRLHAHRIRSSPRPSFNPLGVDPLAIIVVEENDVHQILNEGVVTMDHATGVGFDTPMLEDGPQDLAVVAAE
ncbi:hypothetical protein AMTR_s00026p00179120, partial [Amborella trichopoda]